MSQVAIVIDSTTNLPEEMQAELKLDSAPATIIWSGKELRDNIDISPAEFYTRLATDKEMPTTSQAAPVVFEGIYEKLINKGQDILTIVISSKLSGFYLSAMAARDAFAKAKIEVIDSQTGAMAIGLALPKIVKAAKEGASLNRCREIAENAIKNTGILLMVDTLEFLHRGGRIGGAQKFLATALNFKPILEIVNGGFEGVERVRTRAKAMERLVDLLVERINGRKPVNLAVMHTNAVERAHELLEMAQSKVEIASGVVAQVSPAVGVHLGPGAAGFAYMAGVE